DTRGPGGTGNAIKLQATPLQEGMADLSLDFRGPGVGIEVGWSVVAIEFDNFARRELGTGDRSFRELSVEHPVILLEDPGTTPKEFVVERSVIVFGQQAGGPLGVERAECRLDAQDGIGFRDRGVMDCAR